MSCVRILAQRGWSTCPVLALLVPGLCLALGRTEGFWETAPTEDIETHAKVGAGITWMSDEGAQNDNQELPVLAVASAS